MCKRLRSCPNFFGPVGYQMFYAQVLRLAATSTLQQAIGVAARPVCGALTGNAVEYNEGDYTRVLHAGAGFGKELRHMHVKYSLIPCRRVSQTHGEVCDIQNSRTPVGWPMSRQR